MAVERGPWSPKLLQLDNESAGINRACKTKNLTYSSTAGKKRIQICSIAAFCLIWLW